MRSHQPSQARCLCRTSTFRSLQMVGSVGATSPLCSAMATQLHAGRRKSLSFPLTLLNTHRSWLGHRGRHESWTLPWRAGVAGSYARALIRAYKSAP